MGYTTDFTGSLQLSRPATAAEKAYLDKLAGTRRMQRDVNKLMEIYKGKGGLPNFVPKITDEQQTLIKQLSESGLMVEVKSIKDNRTPEEIYGFKGEYFVGAADDENDFRGQNGDSSVIDHNAPSGEISYNECADWKKREKLKEKLNADIIKQPSLWLQWVLNADGTELIWDGGEKFYSYIEWLKYLVVHFFEPWGIKLNGEIEWVGEDSSDFGKISVKDNVIVVYQGTKQYDAPQTFNFGIIHSSTFPI